MKNPLKIHLKRHLKPLKFLAVLFFLSGILGCSTQRNLPREKHSNLYNREAVKIGADYKIYHQDSTTTTVYLRLNSADFAFIEDTETLTRKAQVLITAKAFPLNQNLKRAVDSVTVKLDNIGTGTDYTQLHTALNLALPGGFAFRAEVIIADVNSTKTEVLRFKIDKRSVYTSENFLLFETSKRIPVYRDYVTRPTRLRIKNNRKRDMTVRHYERNFPLPPPPFSSYTPPPFKYAADSMYTIRATSDFSILDVSKPGFYHVLSDDNQKRGATVFTFPAPFPEVGNTQQMFESLRYLTTEWEYREMKQKGDIRAAIETFWVDCGGSKTKAKELIELYYKRVENANTYFSSFVEGWKTDRGLIHIIYGKPNIIYKNDVSETWIYGEDNNVMSLSFTFVKVINPFSDNDFRLERDENYKASWYRAIETWRNGRIYAN